MKYRDPKPIARATAEEILAANDPDRICETLVALAHHEADMAWVQRLCMRFADQHPSIAVRRVATICLGHLARIHRDKAILVAKPLLERLRGEPDVAGPAGDALDDIQMFIE